MIWCSFELTGHQFALRVRSTGHTLLFTAKNASVLATTIAALDDTPDPGGTDPVTSRSTETGSVSLVGK